jgi:site-specific recombinase XerD
LSSAVRSADSRGRLFIHYHGGGPLGASYPNVVVKRWAGACGIARDVYAYMVRYTYCTRLVEQGVDLYSLKRLMGHKQMAVTLKHYLKLTPAEIRREWKQFNPLVQGVVS